MISLLETKVKNMPTMMVENDGNRIFLHSRYNPKREAMLFVEKNYLKNNGVYIIYGLGLGYHIIELYNKLKEENEDFEIYVYESNLEVFNFAKHNIIMEKEGIKVRFLSKVEFLVEDLKRIKEEKLKFIIHGPSLKVIPNELEELKRYLEENIVKMNSSEKIEKLLGKNFKENIKNYDEFVNELFGKYKNQPFFLVSAGPSLDKNINELKEIYDKKLGKILSVGRAVNALISKGIYPDYIIVTDPKDTIYERQLSHLEINIPVIGLSTVDKNVFKKYACKRYIGFQKGFELAENEANEKGLELINTGGSVATTGLDILIKMGADPIILVGQDFAFTNDRSHSKDSNFEGIGDTNLMRLEKDIYGNDIYTSKNLSVYRMWFEIEIKKYKEITFIDGTEGGLRIEGTKIMTLKEVIKLLSQNP